MFKIRLRWKFFIILLVFSLTPLIVVTVVSQRGTFRLGQTISEDARKRLTQIVGMELRQTADNSARVIQRTQAAMEFYLQVLAAEAELSFMKMPVDPLPVYFASDFEDPRTAPKDLLPSYKYRLKTHDGQFLDNPVSFNHPVFMLASGVEAINVTEDLAILSRMTPTFRKLSHEFGNALQWAHICLKTGVCVSYPGHSGGADGIDPRWQPWFQNAKDTPTWSLPAIDTDSGFLTFTVSKRLYRPDRSFWGVAAIDILFVEALKKSTLSPLWATDARSFIATIAENPNTREPDLRILAQKDYQEAMGAWTPIVGSKWLSSADKVAFNSVLKQLQGRQTGYAALPFQNAEFIWAYAAIDDLTRFIVMVPKSTIMALPEETRKTFFTYLKEQILFAGAATLLTIFFLAAGALIGSYMITRSLLQMATAAKKLSGGDFSVKLGLRTGDERDLVIEAFNQMGPKLADHLRLNQSMDLAMKVQQKLLPARNPEIPGLDIAGKSIYCDETGGDYYDYLEYDTDKGGQVSVVLGDVSGHGISSALLMATARAFLRQRVSLPGTLGQIISDVNRQLFKDVAEYNNFMTLFYLRINVRQKTLEWVRAGQDPAILYDPATRSFETLGGEGIALGVEDSWTYAENQKDDLQAGQIIVMATDGFWESENVSGEMYGKEKIYDLIRAHSELSAKGILNIFIDSLYRFARGKKFEDDVTLVVVKIK
ncbi:MAG: SpoIIE family protein phosphatase [Deltaproteobacteria bacterium]|nr:SpoIIE family protein phosphatase [Deltaproteobacteria bacterium]